MKWQLLVYGLGQRLLLGSEGRAPGPYVDRLQTIAGPKLVRHTVRTLQVVVLAEVRPLLGQEALERRQHTTQPARHRGGKSVSS